MAVDMRFDRSQKVPLLTGKVRSKLPDFYDLRPVIGLPVKATGAVVSSVPKSIVAKVQKEVPVSASSKVLLTATLDLARLKAMNADVIYSALDIRLIK